LWSNLVFRVRSRSFLKVFYTSRSRSERSRFVISCFFLRSFRFAFVSLKYSSKVRFRSSFYFFEMFKWACNTKVSP
jgi:hypothetical protein